jgi:thiosulfate/3-mercaptopyruvate sulfurtransferase
MVLIPGDSHPSSVFGRCLQHKGDQFPDGLMAPEILRPLYRHIHEWISPFLFSFIIKRLFIVAGTVFCLIISGCGPDPGNAYPPAHSVFVSPSWLHDHLNNPALVLLHVGVKEEYDSAHIEGARFISLSDIAEERNGLRLELPPVEPLNSVFESFGISDSSMIVVYWGNDWVSPTTRVFFTLDYVGLGSRTVILDGGMHAWKAEGYSLTADRPPPAQRGGITRHVPNDIVIDAVSVNARIHKDGVSIIDTRSSDFYDGTNDGRGRIPRPGHIAGAVNIPFVAVLNDNTTMKTTSELAGVFRAAGVRPGDEVVTYCHIGQQATLVYVVAKELGYIVRLYDGSYEDWGGREKFPVER